MVAVPIHSVQRAEIEGMSRQLELMHARYDSYVSSIAHGAGHTAPLSFQGVAEVEGQLVAQFTDPQRMPDS